MDCLNGTEWPWDSKAQSLSFNVVLTGYVTRICEIYIDDVLLFSAILARFWVGFVKTKSAKTKLGLKEVEYVGHLITSMGTSFTEEKRLQVLDFPLPETDKALLRSLD